MMAIKSSPNCKAFPILATLQEGQRGTTLISELSICKLSISELTICKLIKLNLYETLFNRQSLNIDGSQTESIQIVVDHLV